MLLAACGDGGSSASDTGDASTGAQGSASGGSTTETGPNPGGDTTSAAAESSGDASTTDTGINPSVIPSLVVEYVDGEGTLQTVQVAQDGSTEIAGAAPLLVFFDATGTRSDTEDTPEAAWWDIGYRLDYGESLGGVWDYGGGSRDEDLGEPVFGRVFTRPGAYVVRLRVRDGVGNESELQLAVATSEPPEPVVIEPDLATWPALTSGSHYQLRAGGDYRGLGELRCGGLHNVLFSKLGEGEDPRIGRFSPEDRGLSSTVLTPARHIRTMDIDVEELHISVIGTQYSGAVRGRVRTFTGDPIGYYYDNAANSEAERENVRYPHGVFLWDTGEINPPSGDQYIMIAALRNFVAQGVDFHKNGAAGNHALRNSGENHVYRHFRVRASVPSASLIKHQAGPGTLAWGSADQYGTVDGAKAAYDHPASKFVMQSGVFHAPGSTIPDICVGAGPENNDVGGQVGAVELMAFSDCVSGQDAWQSVAGTDVQMNGRVLSTRNVRLDEGRGDYVTQSAGAYTNNVPPGWDGPYRYEAENTRPVPSPF